jgi:hypothetical protein
VARFEQGQHPYPDEELVSGHRLADLLGVSKEMVSRVVRTRSGRLDEWIDTQGRIRFHPATACEQWTARRMHTKVTTPTQAQAAAGIGNHGAQATAHLGITNPSRGRTDRRAVREDGEQLEQLAGDLLNTEKRTLAASRASKESAAAELLQIKVRQAQGQLVDRSVVYSKAYAVGNAIKDQLAGIPPQLAPQVVTALEDALVAAGMSAEQSREVTTRANVEHIVREGLRQGILRSLRELTSRPMESLLS